MKKDLSKKIFSFIFTSILVFSLSSKVFAQDIEVEGEIGVRDSSAYNYDVTFSTTSVKWYVTEHSHPNVWNTNSSVNMDNPHIIRNNSSGGVAYTVSLESFVQNNVINTDAQTVAPNLTLNLTGDLSADGVGAVDLSTDYTTDQTYTANLNPGVASGWSYGFTGTYAQPITNTTFNPQYIMTLRIGIAD